ncbi:MAG: nitrous oxide-stimulated promoter family protein, partial [Tissierellales bacterium]|nr:nitrous oxide-stimulated promoter family protein [Tissierellales bacterium]
KCSIHCYEKNVQKKVKEIMRYSGPRIIFYHPITSLKHLISSIF